MRAAFARQRHEASPSTYAREHATSNAFTHESLGLPPYILGAPGGADSRTSRWKRGSDRAGSNQGMIR
jgi:hypothetical protein